MRRILMISGFMIFAKLNAQRYIDYDTIHRNEFSISFQPVMGFFMDETGNSGRINFQFGYRHYFKNKLVLRAALLLFPDTRNGNNYYGLSLYDRTVNGVNVFSTQYNKNGMKTQMNIGLEKIFKVNRLMHGVGVDIFLNHQSRGYDNVYTSYPPGQGATVVSGGYNQLAPSGIVDSLGSNYRGTNIGGGFQVFYSIRYKISRHWYLSGTIGPSVNFSVQDNNFYDNGTRKNLHSRTFDVDIPDMPLISDISICFRF